MTREMWIERAIHKNTLTNISRELIIVKYGEPANIITSVKKANNKKLY